MKGLDPKNWGLWDWIEAACVFTGAVGLAAHTASKDSPELPHFLGSSFWGYLPLLLLVIAVGIHIIRIALKVGPKRDETPQFLTGFQSEPPSEFKLLPIHYTVNLAATLPDVEVHLYVVNFLSRPLTLSKVALSLRLFSSPALEDITFRNEDFEFHPPLDLSARATDGKQTYSYRVGAYAIDGWVNLRPQK